MWTPPLPEHRSSGRDEVEDLLGKGHDQAARKGEKTLGTLGGVMALEGEAHLHHAPAQQNQADGTDQGKMKVERLFTTVSGSLAAKAVVDRQPTHSTVAA